MDEQHDPYHPVCLWRAELKQEKNHLSRFERTRWAEAIRRYANDMQMRPDGFVSDKTVGRRN
jgi:hypothetical protein